MGMSTKAGTELDLRFHGKLSTEISAEFDRLSFGLRGQFNDVVSLMSVPHRDNLDWWVQGPASRNTLSSPFFHYFCCLHLVRRLVDEGRLSFAQIVVDSRVFAEIVERILVSAGVRGCRVRSVGGVAVAAEALLRRAFAAPTLLARKACQCMIARLTRRASGAARPTRPVVLIDTFVTPGYTTVDRWYGGLWDNLTEELKKETFFVPTVVQTPLRTMYSVYRSLRSQARNVVIKEDYLAPDDFLFALGHRRRIRQLSIGPVMVLGHDLAGLVREEIAADRDPLTTIESLLTYQFVKRWSEHGPRVRLAVDWFEGQVIDKAWNLGFKRYFPTVRRIGYRAFESFPFYLCSFPIAIERESGVIPDTVAVQGEGTIATVREFLPDLDVMVIPAFRSQDVWDHRTAAMPAEFSVLITLPISPHSSLRIIHRLIGVTASLLAAGRAIRLVVKPHPTMSVERLLEGLEVELPDALVFTEEKSFPRLLERVHVLITEASSSCLEALACGVPVIIIENEEGLTFDPVPKTIPTDLYRKTRSQAQLLGALTHYRTASRDATRRQERQGQRIKELYFEPITREGIDRFMDINTRREAPNA
jgi:hypothetical protein